MDFGKILNNLRTEMDMRQEDLAKILGVHRASISKYEKNDRFPDPNILNEIADYFNVSVDYLLGRTKNRNQFELDDELPQEALNKINEYIEFIKMKYKNRK